MNVDWPVDGVEAVNRCPVCDSDRRELLYSDLEDRIFFSAPGKWDAYSCKGCSSAYLDPRPTRKTIGLAYDSYFTHDEVRDPLLSSLDFLSRIRRALRNGYRNYYFGTRDRPSSALGVPVTMLMPNAGASIDAEMRHLPRPDPGQRLLDLGCGNSIFLSRARSAGWTVVGADFDAKAVAATRDTGLDVRLGGVEAFDPEVDRFDVITLSHVIEHVHRPLQMLTACHALLKPGGLLWLETPNIASTGHRLYGKNWRGLEPPRHLVLFSLASMQQALANAGFVETEVQPYRRVCHEIFSTSSAIAGGRDAYSAQPSELPRGQVSSAEKIARLDPERREFITLKAWKK